MIKYKVQQGKVEAFEIEKETSKSVLVCGNWIAKRNKRWRWLDTLDDARDFAVKDAERKVRGLTVQLKTRNKRLKKAKEILLIAKEIK